ncbi:hypothetical protein GCM10028857_18720 [Salinarchaeum chitinilyticum]
MPIISAAEYDSYLHDRQRRDIQFLLKRVQPAIYVPDAGKVYLDKSEARQRAGLKEYETRVDWLAEEIGQTGLAIRLLPLTKGMLPWHLEELRPCFERHGFSEFAVYTRQYCGGDRGNRIRELLDHIETFLDTFEPNNLFAIARHGRTHLRRFPPQVTGASGLKQFLKDCDYNLAAFETWRADLERTALNNQTQLTEF